MNCHQISRHKLVIIIFRAAPVLAAASLITGMLVQGFIRATADNSGTEQTPRRYDARSLYAGSLTRHLRLTAGGLALDTGALIEDDAPASGSTHRPNSYDIATNQT